MKEIITSILEAEKRAEQIVLEANENASKMAMDSEAQSEKTKTLATLTFSAERKKAMETANKKAQEKYDAEIESAKKDSQELKEKVEPKISGLVNELIDGLIK